MRIFIFAIVIIVTLPLNGQTFNPVTDTLYKTETGYRYETVKKDPDGKGVLRYYRDMDSLEVMEAFVHPLEKEIKDYAALQIRKREIDYSLNGKYNGANKVAEILTGKNYTDLQSAILGNKFDGVWLIGQKSAQVFVSVKGPSIRELKTDDQGILRATGKTGRLTIYSDTWLRIDNFLTDNINLFGSDFFFVDVSDQTYFKKTNRIYDETD